MSYPLWESVVFHECINYFFILLTLSITKTSLFNFLLGSSVPPDYLTLTEGCRLNMIPGLSAKQLRRIERGECRLTSNAAKKLAQAHGMTPMLADGRHPLTGDALPDESCYQSAKVLRALLVGIDALEQATKRKDRVLPAGAGRPWDAEEDQSLVADFESGTSVGDLAKSHQRTEGAIRSRLMKLGKLLP